MPAVATIAPTDFRWYEFLQARPQLEEANFWKPSATKMFRAPALAPFLFKLKSPHNAICGFGFFARYSHLPAWLAWECFGEGNGCDSLEGLQRLIDHLRGPIGYRPTRHRGEIGCILIVQPTFFRPQDWIDQPRDWPARSLTPVTRALTDPEWRRVWNACQEQAGIGRSDSVGVAEPRYGSPRLVAPRIGQGTFRIAVTDAYDRACAVSGEHSLPALEAAHIKPFGKDGPNEVRNGLLLRADLHRLFDQGYVTVTADARFEVGHRLRQDFDNGHSYYPFHGKPLRLPSSGPERPDEEFLAWHREHRFLG
jgi:putative restriction endonuclease